MFTPDGTVPIDRSVSLYLDFKGRQNNRWRWVKVKRSLTGVRGNPAANHDPFHILLTPIIEGVRAYA